MRLSVSAELAGDDDDNGKPPRKTSPRSQEEGLDAADAQQGDAEALGRLIIQYEPYVKQFLRNNYGTDAPVDDVFQEAVVKVLQNISGFRGESGFRTWFCRIALNCMRDVYRKKGRRREVPLQGRGQGSSGDEPDEGIAAELAERAIEGEPVMQLEQEAAIERINAALNKLTDDHRILLDLFRQGYEYESIAVIEDIPVGTVRSRIHRARIELMKLLGVDPEEAEGDDEEADAEVLRGILWGTGVHISKKKRGRDKEPRLRLVNGHSQRVNDAPISEPRLRDMQGYELPDDATRCAIHDALLVLPDDQRIALDLWDQNIPINVIAEMEGVTALTVKNRIRRARQKLVPILRSLAVAASNIRRSPRRKGRPGGGQAV